MRMRIAHVTATFPPYQGGTGNVCYHNACDLARRGHDVHVFTAAADNRAEQEFSQGIHIHRLRPLLRFGNAVLLAGLARSMWGFDIVHMHYPFFGGEITALAARINRIPLVITYHQDVLLSGLPGMIEKVLRYSVGRMALRSAARVLFTSLDYGQASYIRPLLRGREQQIGELPNGVDTTYFSPGLADPQLAQLYGLRSNTKVALLVAGLDKAHYFKGVDVFLEAIAQLPEHIYGLIVGDGDLHHTYQNRAQELGLAQRVIFAGRISNAALLEHYRLADVTVLPSVTMGEAFGLVLIESLACGTPVIASNLPGVRTVIRHGQDGLLVKPGDSTDLAHALHSILEDDQRRQEMGKLGREHVTATYDWEKIGNQLEEMYSQILGSSYHYQSDYSEEARNISLG